MTTTTTERAGSVEALLADGRIVVLQPPRPEHRELLRALHAGLSAENRRRRFLAATTIAGQEYADHLTSGDDDVMAQLAMLGDQPVGVASAERTGRDVAELAIAVADDFHGVGVGTLLLEHLAVTCRERGITRLTGEVLGDNHEMMRLLLDAGVDLTHALSGGVVHVEMSTAATARAAEAAAARESSAEARSLAPLLSPRGVAVVGVRRDGTGVGAAILAAIHDGGFSGRLGVIHPQADEIAGTPCYPSVARMPGQVDLVIIAVPAASVEQVLGDAVASGVRAAVVVSSGFAELGTDGAAMQQRLRRLARARSVRLVGPNCLGLLSNAESVRLDATFGGVPPRPGGLALASQSGGVGIVVLDQATRSDIGVHAFVSLGNKLDVSGNDLISAWYDDPGVTAAGIYLESFGNPRKFLRLARRFSDRKPLLAVRAARSVGGRRASAAHTAASGDAGVGMESLLAQAGVLACDSAEELAQAALVLDRQPLPGGHRLGILTNAAGLGVLAADAAERRGLDVPQLSTRLAQRLRRIVPDAAVGNPVDLGVAPAPEQFAQARDALVASGEVDAVLEILVHTRVTSSQRILANLAGPAAAGRVAEVVVPLGMPGPVVTGATTLPSVTAAVTALAKIADYGRWRLSEHKSRPPGLDAARAFAVRRDAQAMSRGPGRTALSQADIQRLLRPYGLMPSGFHPDLDGRDLAVRLAPDAALGPVITATYSGGYRDVWPTPLVLVPPLSERDIEVAIRSLGTWPLLGSRPHRSLDRPGDGRDRSRPFDVGAVAPILEALSSLAVEVPELIELDVDPLRVTTAGARVGAARAWVAPSGPAVLAGSNLGD